MYGIPNDLDLDILIGAESTQIRVGQFDIQFTIGRVDFRIQSKVTLHESGEEIGLWEEGHWPDSAFYKIMNVPVKEVKIVLPKEVLITFENGISICLSDSSDQFESMQISVDGEEPWII